MSYNMAHQKLVQIIIFDFYWGAVKMNDVSMPQGTHVEDGRVWAWGVA